ncbi:hypothetical protein D1816_13780 [Aquimarina sp. AD10]|nr:hypothetical protein D1816_13780 [Aquimarina sp. AD10]RKN01435.1 hypothetical protein D7033_04195 [Aquimarina sp. AD10]
MLVKQKKKWIILSYNFINEILNSTMKKHIIYTLLSITILSSGCEEAFIEKDLAEETITIIAPKDGAQIEATAINFNWDAVDQATGYRLQIARPNFENAAQIVEDTVVTGTQFSVNLVKNTYEWRVRAQNSGTATPYVAAGFTVAEPTDFSSRQVLLVSPANQIFTNEPEITMQWQVVEGADSYRVQLLNASDEVLQEETPSTTSVTLTFPEGATRWQVRAENATQNTLYTTRSLTIDTMNPNVPTATAPANNATITGTAVSFTWTRAAVAGSEEIDTIFIYEDEALTQLVIEKEATSPEEITLEANKTYYWFLKASDQANNESAVSTTFTFSIN